MRKFCRVAISIFLVSIIIFGFYIGGKTTIESASGTISIQNSYLGVIISVVLLILLGIRWIFSCIKRLFSKAPLNASNFAKELELIFSSILLKDADAADMHIKKIRKEIKDTPLLYWLDGNVQIIKDNPHKAKSLFYMAAAGEEKSALGSYSLCRLAVQTKDRVTERETIETILQTSGYQEQLVMRLLAISLLNSDFISADKCISRLKEHKSVKRLEGIVLYSEASHSPLQAYDKLKSAYELAPDIAVIAIEYAKSLVFNQEFKKAKSVIEKTWAFDPHPELFAIYLKLDKELADKIDAGYNLVARQTNSWIGYFEYGKFLLDNGHLFDAFCNLLAAYGKCRYKCVYDVLYHVCGLLPDPKPESALEILSGKHNDEVISGEITWHCTSCGAKHSHWNSVCDKCECLDSITWGLVTSDFRITESSNLLGIK